MRRSKLLFGIICIGSFGVILVIQKERDIPRINESSLVEALNIVKDAIKSVTRNLDDVNETLLQPNITEAQIDILLLQDYELAHIKRESLGKSDHGETQDNNLSKSVLDKVHRVGSNPEHEDVQNDNHFVNRVDMEHIFVENATLCKSMKFLVFECTSHLCGGWGDRQKGIVTGFLLALLTNRYFAVNITKPCDVEKFLEPALYNWKMCKRYIESLRATNDTQSQYNGFKNVVKFDFEKEWNKCVVVLHHNAFIIDKIKQHQDAKKRINWMFDQTNPEIIRMILETLFKPGERMLDELRNYSNKITNNGQRQLICTHIRADRNPSISTNNNTIFSFLEKYNDVSKYVIYVATDSDDVRNSAAQKFRNYANLNRTIVHVDRFRAKDNKTEICEGFYFALFEQYFLAHCDVLVITRSNFGAIAGYIRGVSDGLYLYDTRVDAVIETNLTNIQSVYKFI